MTRKNLQRRSERKNHIQKLIISQKRRLDRRDIKQAALLGFSLDVVQRMSTEEKRLRLMAIAEDANKKRKYIWLPPPPQLDERGFAALRFPKDGMAEFASTTTSQ